MLPKENRFVKEKNFRKVFEKGKGVKEGPLMFKWIPVALGTSRFAFSVSRKVSKKAVVRNSIRRALREETRLLIPFLKKRIEGVVIVRPGAEKKEKKELRKDLVRIFTRMKLIKINDRSVPN